MLLAFDFEGRLTVCNSQSAKYRNSSSYVVNWLQKLRLKSNFDVCRFLYIFMPIRLLSHCQSDDDSPLTLPSDIEGLSERDTLAYVIGALVHRLDCKECSDEILDKAKPTSRTFTSFMILLIYVYGLPTKFFFQAEVSGHFLVLKIKNLFSNLKTLLFKSSTTYK